MGYTGGPRRIVTALVEQVQVLLLLGGPAGAGKSTLARAWCAGRWRAVHIELDEVRGLIVSGRADPQQAGDLQTEQYALSVRACCALARVFLDDGYDVVVDDVLFPAAYEALWRDLLRGMEWRLVIVLPSLDEILARSRGRAKWVMEEHSRVQHEASKGWPEQLCIDTTGLSVQESVELLRAVVDR